MRLAHWGPPGPDASWSATLAPHLGRETTLARVEAEPAARPAADLDLYEIADEPAHAFVYRAALARPGVVALRDWSLPRLVAGATLGAGDVSAYLREARRAHGEAGAFVARQVARGLGGRVLPALFSFNDRLLEGSLGVVAPTRQVAVRVARRAPGRPLLKLPLDALAPAAEPPGEEEARRRFGLPPDAPVLAVDAEDPEAARLGVVAPVLARLGEAWPELRVLWIGAPPPDVPGLPRGQSLPPPLATATLLAAVAAADVLLALRFPAGGGLPRGVVRALEAGRPALVSAGTAAAEELPEGVVVPVDPDAGEAAQVEALVSRLLRDRALRRTIGAAARAHLRTLRDPRDAARRFESFLREVLLSRDGAERAIAAARAHEGTLLGDAVEEVGRAARDLGLGGVGLGLEPLLAEILGDASRAGRP